MRVGEGAVLVTGGLGCIGAWTVRELLVAGLPVVVLDPSDEREDCVTWFSRICWTGRNWSRATSPTSATWRRCSSITASTGSSIWLHARSPTAGRTRRWAHSTLYGPGRDRGLTSSLTKAMLAAVQAPVDGAHVVNLNGVRASIDEIVARLRDLIGAPADGITAGADPPPFPDDIDTTGLEVIGRHR